ncbi:MAG: hypothetical protein ACD_20C00014G0004 [uncultured bacterium]|nr:MAG: hypothetical protein ACD_20C00014G0004 [uncultured bacterium]
MGKKRITLNQDYFKVDAKNIRRGILQEKAKQDFRLLEVKVKRTHNYPYGHE